MDMSSQPTPEEDRVMSRQLYRAGQSKPAASTPSTTSSRSYTPPKSTPKKGSATSSGQSSSGQRIVLMILTLGFGYYLLYGNPNQRRKTLVGLAVAGWLLMLGGISYCLCLPDLVEMNRERRAVFEDPNLTFEQKREKIREMDANLSPSQRRQMREISRKEFTRKNNSDTFKFLQMTPEEQMAQLRKDAAEREKFFQKMRQAWGNKGNNRGGPNGGKGGQNGGKGGPNGGKGGGGPPGGWGGGGGGGGNPAASFASREDSRSPEARAGGAYKMGLSQQMGLNSGFGRGGGPGGGKR